MGIQTFDSIEIRDDLANGLYGTAATAIPDKFGAFGSIGLYSIGGTSGQYDYQVISSTTRVSLSEFLYVNNDFVIKFDKRNVHVGAQILDRNSQGNFKSVYVPIWFDDYVNVTSNEITISIPKNTWCFLCFSYPDSTQTITDLDGFIQLIDSSCKIYSAEKAITKPSAILSAAVNTTFYGNISIKKAEEDILVSCDDWSSRTCEVYKYNSDDPLATPISSSSIVTDFVIKKGEYYRYAFRYNPAVDLTDSNIDALINSIHESSTDWRDGVVEYIEVNSPLDGMEKDIFSGAEWGYYRADYDSGTGEAVVSETSATSYGMKDFAYAKTDLLLIGHASSDVVVGFFVCTKNEQTRKYYAHYLSWYNASWFGNCETYPIPKGSYYWIGFRKSPVSTIASQEEYREIVRSHFKILETLYGGCISDSNLAASYCAFSNISIRKAEHSFRVIPNDNTVIYRLAFYDSDEFNANRIGGKVSNTDFPATVPKGSYYRLTFAYADSRTLENLGDFAELMTHFSIVKIEDDYKDPALIDARSINSKLSLLRRRIARLEADAVPSYYVSHIEAKTATINSLKPTNGNQFIFITDVHYNGYNNAKHSKSLINYLCRYANIDFVVNGGDVLSVPQDQQNKLTLMDVVRDSFDYTTPDNDVPSFFVFGNHDNGVDYIVHEGDVTTFGPYLDSQDVISTSGNPARGKVLKMDADKYAQFYYDDDKSKIRYIFGAIDVGDSVGQRWASAVSFVATSMMSCPAGYKIVLINHIIVNSDDEFYPPDKIIPTMADAYNAKTSYTYWSVTYDFSSVQSEVILIVGGHSHKDLTLTTTGGIKVLITTTDNAGAEQGGLDRTIGTVNEQAFDVYTINLDTNTARATRIGAGSDRSITF